MCVCGSPCCRLGHYDLLHCHHLFSSHVGAEFVWLELCTSLVVEKEALCRSC
ncbi:22486_t:CDS:2, partial [Gigaspora rosea]